eukprot:scaffold97166_cov33-Tisochrysis_lutea.AAC.1
MPGVTRRGSACCNTGTTPSWLPLRAPVAGVDETSWALVLHRGRAPGAHATVLGAGHGRRDAGDDMPRAVEGARMQLLIDEAPMGVN